MKNTHLLLSVIFLLGMLSACSDSSSTTGPCIGSGCPGANTAPSDGTGNHAPVANAGQDQSVTKGSTVTLSCSGSSDADGDTLSYSWGILGMPKGSQASLQNPTSCSPSFVADIKGHFVLTLLVSDGKLTHSDTVTVRVGSGSSANQAPQAKAGADKHVLLSEVITLDGSASTDADNDPLTYAWTLSAVPEGSRASLTDANTAKPKLTPDVEGEYVVVLQVNDGKVDSAPAKVVITAHRALTRLGYDVIDAEYSDALDRLIMVSASPNRLHIYNPEVGTEQTVDLSAIPTSVSVSPNGKYAAVGHNQSISYVNLSAATLDKTLNVATDVGDIVLAGNGYVHAFPKEAEEGAIVRIHSVSIATGTDTEHSGITAISGGIRAVLHPSGESMYGVRTSQYLTEALEKYTISSGVAAYAYDSIYNGEPPLCGNLWLTQDGADIFTACGDVFRTGTTQQNDMIQRTTLGQLTRIRYLDDHKGKKLLAVIPGALSSNGNTDAVLQYYNSIDLSLIVALPLPQFVEQNQVYTGHGRYVFFKQSGDVVHIILQADASAGIENDYSVITYRTPSE